MSSPRRAALTLIEAVIALAITGGMLVAAKGMIGSAARGRQIQNARRCGPALARQLLVEVLTAAYVDPNGAPVFGPETGETTRADFDDVDDYNGWSECPPRRQDGTAMADLAGWRRSVSVQYVNVDNPDQVAGSDTGLKRVTVTVIDPAGRRTSAAGLRSSKGMYEARPAQQTTYLSAVNVEVQVGDDARARVVTGAHLLNRVPVGGS